MLAPSANSPTTSSIPLARTNTPALSALVIAIGSAAAIAGAWFFELVIKLKPCPMCLEERIPYYIAIPLGLIVALAAWRKAPRWLVIGGLVILALAMAWNAYMGVFHSGVEWKWWAGPTDCSGAADLGPASGLMDRLKTINITRCDEAAWRLFGLSLAGYNAIVAAGLTMVALFGIKAASKN